MKYMLLIHQGTTPTPQSPEAWATLSEDEQSAVYRDYTGDQRDARRHPGRRGSRRPRRRRPCACRTARR